MELGNELILVGAGLIVLSIFAGLVSSRIGAPLLLVFLGLGMLAGEEGPGGIEFDDFGLVYVAGSIALAIILFDGGLRTSRARLRIALWPSLLLSTVGVLITAALTGVFAALLFDLTWLEGLLVGSVVASTDAAAVFFLLHLRSMRLKERIGATLEVESGANDPMAIFLTLLCVELLTSGANDLSWEALESFIWLFARQISGGAVIGLLGGYVMLFLINRVELASGLYPILAVSMALVIFAGAQTVGASGFLAVYVAGIILGNYRHRAMQLISRFHDGLAWLSQIVMFLLLGLLVTPSTLVPTLLPSLAIALFLILLGRPLAVLLCLLPFDFSWREQGFIAWVGLRGAVPIFLGTIPVLAGVEGAATVFGVAYVVVLTSLLIQGWTVATAARRLKLDLPPRPEPPRRIDIDLPTEAGRDMAAYTVQPMSIAARRTLSRLPLPQDVEIVSVMREGALYDRDVLEQFAPGDYVLVMTPSDHLPTLDRLFGARVRKPERGRTDDAALGEFAFDGEVPVGAVAGLYGFPVPEQQQALSLGAFLRTRLIGKLAVGRRLRLGDVDLVVRELDGDRIIKVGLDLEPEEWTLRRLDPARAWFSSGYSTAKARLGALLRRAA